LEQGFVEEWWMVGSAAGVPAFVGSFVRLVVAKSTNKNIYLNSFCD